MRYISTAPFGTTDVSKVETLPECCPYLTETNIYFLFQIVFSAAEWSLHIILEMKGLI